MADLMAVASTLVGLCGLAGVIVGGLLRLAR